MDPITVLIAAPGSHAISDELVSRIGGTLHWLCPHEAAEIQAVDPEIVKTLCRSLPIDVNLVAWRNRRKKLLLADMDSTMIHEECIDEIGKIAGVGEQIGLITARAMAGELDFEEALKERVHLLKGLPDSVISDVIARRISFRGGGAILIATLKRHGCKTALVSGGFTAFTGYVADKLGFDHHSANRLIIQNHVLTGEVAHPILGKVAKVDALLEYAAMYQLSPRDVIAVGDGANDIPMLLEAGMGVALHAKPNVQKQASFVINHGDLTALLYLQGYHKDEFVMPGIQ